MGARNWSKRPQIKCASFLITTHFSKHLTQLWRSCQKDWHHWHQMVLIMCSMPIAAQRRMIRLFVWYAISGRSKVSLKNGLLLGEIMAITAQRFWPPLWEVCQACMNRPLRRQILSISNHLMASFIRAISLKRCLPQPLLAGLKTLSYHMAQIKLPLS